MKLLTNLKKLQKPVLYSKPKVFIRVHSVRRDGGYNLILKEILESFGFEVFLGCTRNINFCLTFWKPDIVIISTFKLAKYIKKKCPSTFLVFLEGEGFQINDDDRADYCFKHKTEFDLYDLVLLWGDAQLKGFRKFKNLIDIDKIFAVGNPKVDVAKYLPINKIKHKRKSLGFLCRFTSINHHEGIPVIRNLEKKKQLDYAIMLLKSYHSIHKSILFFLKNTEFKISIRPHPTEAIDTYYKYVIPSFGGEYKDRIEIDKNLFVTDWMIRQKMIFCPSSTAFIEAYIMKIPVVNLDNISGVSNYSKNWSQASSEWLDASLCPDSQDELLKLVMKDKAQTKSLKIDKQLNQICNFNKNESSLLNVAYLIKEKFKKKKINNLGIPTFILKKVDDFLFKRVLKKNSLHTNFSYKSGFHKNPIYLNEFLHKILKNKSNDYHNV